VTGRRIGWWLGSALLLLGTPTRAARAQECRDASTAHPEWILCDDFESGRIDPNIWNDRSGDNALVTRPAQAGSYALDMRHPARRTGGYMNSLWYRNGYSQLHDRGYPHLYLRWWSSFDAGFNSSTKIAGFEVKSSDLASFWEGHRGAGLNPDGVRNGGSTRIVTEAGSGSFPGTLRFYTYHPEMMLDRWTEGSTLRCAYYGDSVPPPPGWRQSRTLDPTTDYYCSPPGTAAWNEFSALLAGYDPGTYLRATAVPRGQWTCIEIELRVNDPSESNGHQRFWVNDDLVGEWYGLRFSEPGTTMRIHGIQLTASSPESHPADQHSYYDGVVVSMARIGCGSSSAAPDGGNPGAADAGMQGGGSAGGRSPSGGCASAGGARTTGWACLVLVLAALASGARTRPVTPRR
jgi:hypothetical protein